MHLQYGLQVFQFATSTTIPFRNGRHHFAGAHREYRRTLRLHARRPSQNHVDENIVNLVLNNVISASYDRVRNDSCPHP